MKKILLAVIALSIALTFSSGCYAQGTEENPGPRVDNTNTNSGNGSDRYIPIGSGAQVYDTETGMIIPNPDLFPSSSSSSSGGSSNSSSGGGASVGCDPLTSGWEACLNATQGSVMIGGDQGSKMEENYRDTYRNTPNTYRGLQNQSGSTRTSSPQTSFTEDQTAGGNTGSETSNTGSDSDEGLDEHTHVD